MRLEQAPLPAVARNGHTPQRGRFLGAVVAGSLTKGLDVRLDAGTEPEGLAVGRYVSIAGAHHTFFGMVTDIELRATTCRSLPRPRTTTSSARCTRVPPPSPCSR